MTWILAIDFGTTSTAAARRVRERIELVQIEGAPRMPSLVFWREGTGDPHAGRLILGQEADELSPIAPWDLERTPKIRLAAGDETMLLGDQELRVVEVIGQILRRVTTEALVLSGGERPAEVRLTHPARWSTPRLERLRAAAQGAGIANPVFVPEPVAAATHFASERLSEGDHVAVYDLGGGTLDTAVLRRTADSFALVGRPGGEASLGGENFDDYLYRYLGERLPGETWQRLRNADRQRDRNWAHANRQLLRDARRAKERLSSKTEAELILAPPIDTQLQVTAPEFEALISSNLSLSISELERTILDAGLRPQDLAAVYLAGASSRIPLVTRLISERLGVLPERFDDPKAVTALGAARLPSAASTVPAIAGKTPAELAPSTESRQPLPVQEETALEQRQQQQVQQSWSQRQQQQVQQSWSQEHGYQHLDAGGVRAAGLPYDLALRMRLAAAGVALAGAVIFGAMFLPWVGNSIPRSGEFVSGTYWRVNSVGDIVGAVLAGALITFGLVGGLQEDWGRRAAPVLAMLGAIAFGYFFSGTIELLAAGGGSLGPGALLLSAASCAGLAAGVVAFGASTYDSDRAPPRLALGPGWLWATVAIVAAVAIFVSYFLDRVGRQTAWETNSPNYIFGTLLATAMIACAVAVLRSSRLARLAFPMLAAANFGFNNPVFPLRSIVAPEVGQVGMGYWLASGAGVVLLICGVAMLDRRAWSPANA